VTAQFSGTNELARLVLGVVVVTLLIQGLTLEPVLRRTLGLTNRSPTAD